MPNTGSAPTQDRIRPKAADMIPLMTLFRLLPSRPMAAAMPKVQRAKYSGEPIFKMTLASWGAKKLRATQLNRPPMVEATRAHFKESPARPFRARG